MSLAAGRESFAVAVLWLCMLMAFWTAARAAQGSDSRVGMLKPSFLYWSPELRELHVRVPVRAEAVGGEELFVPKGVLIDGVKPRYAYWYFDGATYDYSGYNQASRRKIEVFIPLAWRARARYQIELAYEYAGRAGTVSAVAAAPEAGGVWQASGGANRGFLVREGAGLARSREPVEFDLTVPATEFPRPQQTVRATIMTEPGMFKEIPCQVYAVDRGAGGEVGEIVRFRAVVQLSMEPKQELLMFLWNCSSAAARSGAEAIQVHGSPIGGTIENRFYKIQLSSPSGQLLTWTDKQLGVTFQYNEQEKTGLELHPIQITPDLYRDGQPWSHAGDWDKPQRQALAGPVFCETVRTGAMPRVPEVTGRVTYRFYADRPEVRISSVLSVTQNVPALAFRNGGMIFDHELFTHAAWPRQDGSIVRIPIQMSPGNDTGSPPPGRMPFNTPWVAFCNEQTRCGIALITTNLAFFNEGLSYPNMSNALYYVSLYRNRFLYTVRAMNMNYSANIRSYPSPMQAGTVLYEEMAMVCFKMEEEGEGAFKPVEELRQRLLKPLVVVP